MQPPRPPNSVRYAILGALLAGGAPTGWLVIEALMHELGPSLRAELADNLGLYVYMLVSTLLIFTAFGAWSGQLVDRLMSANTRLEEMATTDALTLLRNARHFHEQLQLECARADRERRPLALLVADLDFFKRVNDRWGHATGDESLAHVAKIIRGAIRAGDVACRIGGEEFAILCPGADLEEAHAIAERIRSTLESSPVLSQKATVPLTLSLGLAAHSPGEPSGALFRKADEALYAAKGGGRNRVEAHSPARAVHVP